MRLEVYTPTFYDALGIDLYGDIFVGRNQAYPGQPLLDLERYGAKELGVSRQHLMLRPTSEGVMVIDQGSTNGTNLNGALLPLGVATKLKDGDVLRLSLMALVVHIGAPPGQLA